MASTTLNTPFVTSDGSVTLYSERYAQTYHSKHGALTECRHVFLEGSGIAERLDADRASQVLEVGFGTGMNFLLTAHHALQTSTPLQYFAFEHDLLPHHTLSSLQMEQLPIDAKLIEGFLAWRKTLGKPEAGTLLTWQINDTLALGIQTGDAVSQPWPNINTDAVYLDAFSPDTNPECWTPSFLSRLFDALVPGGRLSTYSAKGSVRRALLGCGFEVERRPGPPGKREMLVAIRPSNS